MRGRTSHPPPPNPSLSVSKPMCLWMWDDKGGGGGVWKLLSPATFQWHRSQGPAWWQIRRLCRNRILRWILQCCSVTRLSMTVWCGSGSGSTDPCLWLMDPDPRFGYFRHWPSQDANKELIFDTIFSVCYFLKVHFHYFSKIKRQKKSQNSRITGFPPLLFLHDVLLLLYHMT